MSVSEGIKKHFNKNYYVNLIGEDKVVQKIKIQPWTKVYELKIKISQKFFINYKNVRLFYCNIEMIDNNNMLDYKIIDAKNPEIFYKFSDFSNKSISLQVYGALKCSSNLLDLIEKVKLGFLAGLIPNLIPDGTSGTYKLRDPTKEIVALFKPIDEEAFAPNNQKGYMGKFGQESFRKGILSGEGSIREVVAYLLDKKNFFKVPETTFVEICHPSFNKNDNGLLMVEENSIPKVRNSIIHNFIIENIISDPVTIAELDKKFKNNMNQRYVSERSPNKEDFHSSEKSDNSKTLDTDNFSNNKSEGLYSDIEKSEKKNLLKKYGSFQKFIVSDDIAANYSYSLFDTYQIHRIGILDLRILNCDRNDENILIKKHTSKTTGKLRYKLIPIDHSLSFPDCIKISEYEMCWMGWEQSNKPFCEELKKYIRKINIIEDMNRLSKAVKMREKCWKNFRIANLVLKISNEFNLTLFQIGSLIYRPGFQDVPSEMEKLIIQTNKTYFMYKTIFGHNIPPDYLSFNMQNGKIFNTGIKIIDCNINKKIRKTSMDIYPIKKNSETNTPNKHNDLREFKGKISKIKRNLMEKIDKQSILKDDLNSLNSQEMIYSIKSTKNLINNLDLDEYNGLKANSNRNEDKNKKNLHNKEKKITKTIKKTQNDSIENIEFAKITKRKKTSLLRRTTSVPKLSFIENTEKNNHDLKFNVVENESTTSGSSDIIKTDGKGNLKNENLKYNEIDNVKISHKNSLNAHVNSLAIEKDNFDFDLNIDEFDNEKENEKLIELDNPYNELFFYLFENIFEEYLKAKFKNN